MSDTATDKKNIDRTTKEWVGDFKNKYNILKSRYAESFQEDLYRELHGSLDAKCNLSVNEHLKRNNISFESLMEYIEDYDTVFIYPQIYDYQYDGKKHSRAYEALKAIKCFVVDLDEVTSADIVSILDKIDSMEIKPNYIVNSGGGLHLYYVFRDLHYIKASVGIMAYTLGLLNTNECLTHKVIYHDTYRKLLETYTRIKTGMTLWFSDSPNADTNNHLAQPIRLFGSKTKNPKLYTQIFKVSDVKYSIQEIADTFDIELPEEADNIEFNKMSLKFKRQYYYMNSKMKKELELKADQQIVLAEVHKPPDVKSSLPKGKYRHRINFKAFKEKANADYLEHKNSPEYLANYEYVGEQMLKKRKKKSLRDAQAKGMLSQYNQFREIILKSGRVGNRRNCLYCFYHRAHMYTKNEAMILGDYSAMASAFNALSRTDKLTSKQINEIPNAGTVYKLPDAVILEKTGSVIQFEQKKKQERLQSKEATKMNRDTKLQLILEVATKNPALSYRELSNVLKSLGVKCSPSSLLKIDELKIIKNSCSV